MIGSWRSAAHVVDSDSDQTRDPATPDDGRIGAIVEHLLEGLQLIGPDFRYLYVNPAVARHGRMPKAALLGRLMTEVYPGIEHTAMFAVLRRCLDTRQPERLENEFVYPDGSRAWFELRFEPVPEGVAILSIDISELKRSEASLQRTIRALNTLSRCNRTLVGATDPRRFMADVCALVVEAGMYSGASVILADRDGLRIEAAAGTAHPAVNDGAIREAIRTGRHVIVRSDDGSEVGPLIVLPIVESGRCDGVLAIAASDLEAFDDAEQQLLDEVALDLGHGLSTLRDRAAQRRTVIELDEAKLGTRAIYDHLPDPTLVWQRRGQGFVLVDCNAAARTVSEGRITDLLGSSTHDIDGIPELEADLRRCLEDRAPNHREAECTLPGTARRRRLVLSYGFIPPDAVLLHVVDVTDRRSIEEQLLAAQRLEAVGRLAGGIAHDFNNLLSVILSYTSLVLEQLEPTAEVRADIGQVHEAGLRAAALTRQLLAFSRKQVLSLEITDLRDVIGGLEPMLRRVLGEDIDIRIHAPSDLGTVLADRGQLEQVLMNLVVNARDAMPEGGRLTITLANTELDEAEAAQRAPAQPGPYLVLSVSDTGCGMDSATKSRIFEPFFTTKEKHKGTGLGLSTVYGIVAQSGGNVRVHSERGRGTTFEIYLPRVEGVAAGRKPVRAAAPRRGFETVLVVEDDDAVRSAAERILGAAGYRVLVANDAERADALCDAHQHRLDLLLTDVVMPLTSGRDVAERLKRKVPGLKVLFMSGYADDTVVHHDRLDPDTRFIAKPFAGADLLLAVRDSLDRP